MDVLVTGAGGFIGGTVARRLAAGGHRVFGLHRRPEQAGTLSAAGIVPVTGDLLSLDPSTLPRVQGIVHAAAAVNRGTDSDYRRVNAEGTRLLLDWALALPSPPRFVLVSSVGVYGRPASLPADEDTPCRPTNIYEETKLQAEEEARAAARRGLPVVIVRPSWVYGPGDRKNLKLFRMIERGAFRIVGTGRTPTAPVFVEDVAEGICLALTKASAAGGTFILSGEKPVTVAELCAEAARALGRKLPRLGVPLAVARPAAAACEIVWKMLPGTPPLSARRLLFFTRPQAFSIGAASRALGYRPRVALEEGMRRTVTWYREEGWL